MKAIVCSEYGPPEVLRLMDVEKPAPKDNEVLVKIYASALNVSDKGFMRGEPFFVRLAAGLLKPKYQIFGCDIAGEVEAVGKNVKQFQPGDAVFGINFPQSGGFAEYGCVPEKTLVLKPINLKFEEAAAVPATALTALQGLRKGKIQSGQKVLINGAAGGVGTFAVQIAKYFGAEVTGVCSTRHLDMVRSIGADYVIDYTQEDFTKSGQTYDLILTLAGYYPISAYKRALSPTGIYVMCGGDGAQMLEGLLLGPWISMTGSKKITMFAVKPSQEDLIFLKELLETGKVVPVIDRRYPLSEVAEAIRYHEKGHVQGKIVITVEHADKR